MAPDDPTLLAAQEDLEARLSEALEANDLPAWAVAAVLQRMTVEWLLIDGMDGDEVAEALRGVAATTERVFAGLKSLSGGNDVGEA